MLQFLAASDFSPAAIAFFDASLADPGLLTRFELPPNPIVVEVGAFMGTWTHQVRKNTDGMIYCFEPDPPSVAFLRNRFRSSPRVVILDCGLGASNRNARLSQGGHGSSLEPADAGTDYVEVTIRDADEAFSELGIDRIDLLYVNIEGGEFELLPHLLRTGWIDRTGIVLVQFHDWVEHAFRRRRSIRRRLRRTHRPLWDYPWVYEAWQHR